MSVNLHSLKSNITDALAAAGHFVVGNIANIINVLGNKGKLKKSRILENTLRSGALGVVTIASQFGIRITVDTIDTAIEHGQLKTAKDLGDLFARSGVTALIRAVKLKDLQSKSYYFPCVAIFKDGTARIVANRVDSDVQESAYICIDPLDPSVTRESIPETEFIGLWSGTIILISKRTGLETQDKFFNWRWFLPELLRFKWLLILTAITSLIVHLIGLAPIIFIQIALDKVLGYNAVSTLYVLFFSVISVVLFGGVLAFFRNYIINFVATSIEAKLSGDLFDKVIALPAHVFQTTPSSDLEATIQAASDFKVLLSRQILTNLFDAVGIFVFVPILFGYSPILALIAIAFSVFGGFIALFVKWRESQLMEGIGAANTARLRSARESISGIETIKTFSLENLQRKAWRQISAVSIRRNEDRIILNDAVSSFGTTLQQAMTICLVFFGVILAMGNHISIGAIISCNMLGSKIVGPLKNLITFFADLDGIRNNLELIEKTWNGPSERGATSSQHLVKGDISLRDVVVNYGERSVLDSISLTIPSRGKVAVVGPTAAGKTTLLRLFQGLLYPNSGTMNIDGRNFRSIDINHYRNQVCLVDTNPVFFSGTIEENLRSVKPTISERELEEALSLSGFERILEKLPDGLSTGINQAGVPLSQGERILLAISRSLITNPQILLFDEALNNLDKLSQFWLLENLEKIAHGRTLIFVTHDLRFSMDFDSILVLDAGKIEGQGKHSDLLDNCATYAELWKLDLALSSKLLST